MLFHCWTKWRCERLPIVAVTTIESGIVTRAISASSGEITNIIPTMATTVSSEVSSWLRVCCRLCATLSMSLVTRLSSSPRGWASKYGRGSRPSFASTSRRRLKIVRFTAPVRIQPCAHDSTDAAA